MQAASSIICHPERRYHRPNGMCEPCYRKELYQRNPESLARKRLRNSTWARNNPDSVTRTEIKRKYGLTLEEYLQGIAGPCYICGAVNGRLVADHDHDTGEFRGFLCSTCNTGLGKLQDSPDILRKALEYLERNRNVHQPATDSQHKVSLSTGLRGLGKILGFARGN